MPSLAAALPLLCLSVHAASTPTKLPSRTRSRLKEMGLNLGAKMTSAPIPGFFCADKEEGPLALDPARPSHFRWRRCVPADCQDAKSLPTECWRRPVKDG